MRAIVFVRTRILANILASWMDSTRELQHIKARKYTGAQAHSIDGGESEMFPLSFVPNTLENPRDFNNEVSSNM
jgi:hypothetical protein